MSVLTETVQGVIQIFVELFDYIPDLFMCLFILAGLFSFFMAIMTHYFEKDLERKEYLVSRHNMSGGLAFLPVLTYCGILYFTEYTKWKTFLLVFGCFIIKRVITDIFRIFFTKKEVQ